MSSDDGPRHKVSTRKAAITLSLMQVGHRAICDNPVRGLTHGAYSALEGTRTGTGLIYPEGIALPDFLSHAIASDTSGEEFPVRLGVQLSAIHRQAIALTNSVVPFALDFVDVMGNKPCSSAIVQLIFCEWLLLVGVNLRRYSRVRSFFKVEVE